MSEYEVIVSTDSYEVGRFNGYILAACVCGGGFNVPDKGLGRATVDTWKSRHSACVKPTQDPA